MNMLIQQSEGTSARRRVPVYLVDENDGYTPETGVVSPTVEVSKAGAAQAAGTGIWTEVGDGVYYYELAAGEVDTLGFLNVRVVKGGTSREFQGIAQVVGFDPGATDWAVAGDEMSLSSTSVDLIWDEALTSAAHDVSQSAGRRLRQLHEAFVLQQGTAAAGAAGTITLAGTASAVDDYYRYALVVLIENTGAGQTAVIQTYDGTTKVATITPDWRTNPDATTKYLVLPGMVDVRGEPDLIRHNTAQGGGASSITLDASASATDNFYNDNRVVITGGTGQFQSRLITAYNGTTKVATVSPAWDTNPDSTSLFDIKAGHVNAEATVNDADLAAILADTNEMQGKLPTNFIMGSSVTTDKDDEIDSIKSTVDTNLNATVSSRATQADILSDATPFPGAQIDTFLSSRSSHSPSEVQTLILSDATPFAGADITQIRTNTTNTANKLPDNFIMGSSVTTDKDDEIDAMKVTIDANLNTTVSSRATPTDIISDATPISGAEVHFVYGQHNNKYIVNTTNNKAELYSTDGSTIIQSWPLTDKDGNIINVGIGDIAQRGNPEL